MGSLGTKQTFGLIGSAVLFIGVFTPIVSVPIMGSMNYFQNGKGDGVIVLILAGISLFLTLAKQYKGLWFTGFGSLGIMFFTFINFQTKMSQVKSQMESSLAGNPFRGLADMAMQSVQLQWGWAVLVIGAALIIAAAAVKDESSQIEPVKINPVLWIVPVILVGIFITHIIPQYTDYKNKTVDVDSMKAQQQTPQTTMQESNSPMDKDVGQHPQNDDMQKSSSLQDSPSAVSDYGSNSDGRMMELRNMDPNGTKGCSQHSFMGSIIKVNYAEDQVTVSSLVILSDTDDDRTFVNINEDLKSRMTMHDLSNLHTLFKKGNLVRLWVNACGVAGRYLTVDKIRVLK